MHVSDASGQNDHRVAMCNAYLKVVLNQVLAVLLQKLKQLTILDARHLQDLGRSIAEVPLAQCLEECLVNEDCQGCTVGTHLVLSAVEIDCCLDADGSIHCCHDCGGDLDQRSVAPVQVGCQPSHIQTNSTTNCNDGLLAPTTCTAVCETYTIHQSAA